MHCGYRILLRAIMRGLSGWREIEGEGRVPICRGGRRPECSFGAGTSGPPAGLAEFLLRVIGGRSAGQFLALERDVTGRQQQR